ncbi:transglycosylase SLT domain-containing protein [Streptodolium elevatio]|uniref:Transglycosylase SLT domain-containing protein n=1 Tax=Streptodolium elevatio TaxID=3157996 RepID=A0ABV3DLD5_9ACTN
MPGPLIPIGGVGIDVIPNATGIYARLAAQMLPDAERVGRDAGRIIGERIRDGISGAIPHAIQASSGATMASATQQGNRAGGAFGQAMRRRLEAALRSLPNIRIDASTSEADADIQALRVRLESLTTQRIGIDIDAAAARAEAADIEEQLRRLGAAHPNVQVRVDTAAARAALAEFQAEVERLSRTSASPRIEVDGGFAQRLRAAVEAAQQQLPVINIDASTSTAAAQVQALRGQLESLRTVRVGIDLDAATALARISEIQRRLDQIAAGDATADVRVDAAAASATLATIQAQVDALDGDTARIDVDVSAAAAGLVRLTTLAASVGPALVPAFAGAAFGVGAFVSVLSAATAGIGAFAAAAAPGLIDVGQAVMATTAAEEALAAATDKTARGSASQAIAAQQQALSMQGAQASLANAYRSSSQQIADAQERVQDAVQRVGDAQERVADAERAVADARVQAAQRMDAALDRITDAERSRTDAVQDAVRAELALVDARRAAQQQLEDFAARAESGAIAERRAIQQEKDARKTLDAVKKSGAKADSDAAIEAQLAYDEAVLRLKDVRRENARNAVEKAAADKAGVDGSKQVLGAERALADAKQRSVDATKAVTDAQDEARRTQVEGARAIEKAERSVLTAQRDVVKARDQVADAEQAVARARVQGAEQVASAQRTVAAAQLAASAAAVQSTEAMTAANTALDKQKRALADLSPEQRGVYDAVIRLKEGFKAWGDSLSPATMPLLTRAINGLTNLLPSLTPLVLGAAEGFRRLADRARDSFEDPFWDRFKANLVENLPRAVESMGVVFGNVFAGMAGIINAFLPQTDQIADSMEGATASFREWGQGLETSEGFASFREFLAEDWPGVRETFADVGGALWQITKALAEISPSAVLILQGVATAIENTPVWILQTLIDLFFAYRVAVFAMTAVTWLYLGAMKVYTVATALATASTWSLSTALRVLSSANFILFLLTIIGTFTLLMIQSEGFRNKVIGVFKEIGSWAVWLYDEAIKPAFDGISAAAVWLYDKGIKPAFDATWGALKRVGDAAVWLWDNAIRPTWEAISLASRILAAVIATALIAPIVIAFNILSPIVLGLWEHAFKPAFEGIGAAATWLWDNVLKPVIGAVVDAIRGWGIIATWLWEEAVQPAFDGIGDGLGWLWDNVINPVVGAIGDSLKGWGLIAQWLWNEAVKPSFDAIARGATWLWENGIKPPFDLAKAGFRQLGEWAQKLHDEWIKPWFDKISNTTGAFTGGIVAAFSVAKTMIGIVWDGIKSVLAKPINWVIGVVYTDGIKRVWDKVADIVKLPHMPEVKGIPEYATGGIYPGYTPGRDIGLAAVSGGEAIMRPEWTRAVGADYVHGANRAAAAGGVSGARQYVEAKGLPYAGAFALGGIIDSAVDWTKDLVQGAAAKTAEIALRPVKAVINAAPDSPEWLKVVKKIPLALIDGMLDKIRGEDAKVLGGPVVQKALEWARGEAGKPYQWGGGGNPSWDCSGFMAGIQSVILGQKPRRLYTTFDFSGSSAPPGWKKDLDAPFRVGVSNIGVGHMAGTLAGVNVESRGGDGVVVGPSARGADNTMFAERYGFSPSNSGLGQFAPTGALADWIAQALRATGTPPPGSLDQWMRGMATLVGRESGGNVFAVNNWDSNAVAGNSSRGLAQVVPTTFNAFHQIGTSWDIFDPVANLAASINWIKYKYGGIGNVQQADPSKDPKGYALGGIVPLRAYDSGGPLPPGLTLAYNGTGRTEQTYTAEVNRALLTLAARGAADPAAGGGSRPAAGPALVVETWNQYGGPTARQTAEEVRALGTARGPRR